MNWGHRGMAALLTMVLAAILGPLAFGTVAMAMVYIAFLEMFLQQGLNAALIQRKDLRTEHLDATFWMVIVVGLLLTGISLALSGWWASVNKLPELGPIINALSLLIPVQCLTVVQQAILHREMDFKALAVRSNCSVFVGGTVGIGMALSGYGVWALVGQKVSEAVAALLLLWSLSRWRPRFRFSLRHLKDLLGFSIATFVTKLGLFVGNRVELLLIGLFLGPTAVGLYFLAARLLETLLDVATRPFQVVSLPYYSAHQDDRPAIRRTLLKTIRFSASLTIPVTGVLMAMSTPLMNVMGEQWAPAANVVKLLCLAAVFQVVGLFVGPLLQAIGRPKTLMVIVWVSAVFRALSILGVTMWLSDASLQAQLLGLAGANVTVMILINVPMVLYYMKQVVEIRWMDLLVELRSSFLSAVVAGGIAAIIVESGLVDGLPPIVTLGIVGAPAGLTAITALFVLDEEVRHRILQAVRSMRPRRINGGAA